MTYPNIPKHTDCQAPLLDDGAFREVDGEVKSAKIGVNTARRLSRLPADIMPDWPASSRTSDEAQVSQPLTIAEQNANARQFDQDRVRGSKQLRQHP